MTDNLPFNEAETNRKVLITNQDASGRLDAYLATELAPDLSRSHIKSLIEGGAVMIDGTIAMEAKRKVVPDLNIEINIPHAEDPLPKAENIPLNVVYEDQDLIVINKPAGLVVHPGAGNGSGTLVNALIYHCGDSLSGIGGVKRPGIVHRLDKDTSGIMVVAKNDISHRHLADQFADHGRTGPLERAYKALIWDGPTTRKGSINASLGRSNDRLKRAVLPDGAPNAKHAITHYTVLNNYGRKSDATSLASLIECRLETGRTHQIRVHMAHLGFPLIGDDTYGAAFKTKVNRLPDQIKHIVSAFPRQALHAYLLQFSHPQTNQILRFEAPLPDDMQNLMTALEQI